MNDREMRQTQEDRLYEIHFAEEMLKADKTAQFQKYLAIMRQKAKNGMTADEVDTVIKRAKDAASEW